VFERFGILRSLNSNRGIKNDKKQLRNKSLKIIDLNFSYVFYVPMWLI